MQKIFISLGLVVILWFLAMPKPVQAATCLNPLLITELQSGAPASSSSTTQFRYEFVELYNCGSQAEPLNEYQLQFARLDGQVVATVPLQGYLPAETFLWVGHQSYKEFLGEAMPTPAVSFAEDDLSLNALVAEGGQVRLLRNQQLIDQVTYGSEPAMASVPPSGQSIKRCTNKGEFQQTTNSAADFVITALPTLSATQKLGPNCDVASPETPEPPKEPVIACDQLVITEILPNPSGIDAGKEFIELHNPTNQPLTLTGCSLRLGDSDEVFALPAVSLPAGAYHAFYDSETGLQLPNATGQTVWLLGGLDEQGVPYGDQLADNISWSLFEVWQATSSTTPGAANQQTIEDPVGGKGAGPKLEPCDPGQERNPKTNRCRAIAAAAEEPLPCKAGQERNLTTGRCKTVSIAAAALTPCKPGQERNPQTNRCRSVVAANGAELEPCAEGQERNPQTNRCRKVSSVSTGSPVVADVPAATATLHPAWIVVGVVGLGVVGYAIFEWRQEIAHGWQRLIQKFKKQK